MKRTIDLNRPIAGAGLVLLLAMSLAVLGGCSDGGAARETVAARHGIERSEFIALKKATKDPADFKDVLLKKKFEKLKEKGVIVETTASRKTSKKDR
jgi:hypothetical protein